MHVSLSCVDFRNLHVELAHSRHSATDGHPRLSWTSVDWWSSVRTIIWRIFSQKLEAQYKEQYLVDSSLPRWFEQTTSSFSPPLKFSRTHILCVSFWSVLLLQSGPILFNAGLLGLSLINVVVILCLSVSHRLLFHGKEVMIYSFNSTTMWTCCQRKFFLEPLSCRSFPPTLSFRRFERVMYSILTCRAILGIREQNEFDLRSLGSTWLAPHGFR